MPIPPPKLTIDESAALIMSAAASQEVIGISLAQLAAASADTWIEVIRRFVNAEIRAGHVDVIQGVYDLQALVAKEIAMIIIDAKRLHEFMQARQDRPAQPPKSAPKN